MPLSPPPRYAVQIRRHLPLNRSSIPSLHRRARSPLSCYFQPSPRSRNGSPMAVLNLGCGGDSDKENAPPSSARGIAVRKQSMMKRPGCSNKARKRLPLRDITCLFLAEPRPTTSLVPEGRGEPAVVPDTVALPEAVCALVGAPSNWGVVKQGRPSLRKGFR